MIKTTYNVERFLNNFLLATYTGLSRKQVIKNSSVDPQRKSKIYKIQTQVIKIGELINDLD